MRVLWMKEHQPDVMAKARKWLLIEDFVNCRLCGEMATDYSMASCMLLLDQRTRQWSGELLAASGIEPSLLPEPRPSGTPLGKVSAEAAALTGLPAGTPVILGGHDHICGTLPCGAYKPGTALDIIGTWESVLTTLSSPALTPAVHAAAVCMQSHVAEGMYAAWGGAVAGESIEWFRREFGAEAKRKAEQDGGSVWTHLLSGLEDTQPGASGVMYLPHISAAGCPIDDNRSLGAFVGISNTATKADLLRAVIEGVNYQFLHIIESMSAAMENPLDRIIVTGGVVQNEFWMQNKADMLGLPVEISEVEEATPQGAAMLAGLGLGLYHDLDEAYERVKRPGRTYQPDTSLTDGYRQSFDIYKRIYPALKPISHRIFDVFKG
jgi:xylulokinase